AAIRGEVKIVRAPDGQEHRIACSVGSRREDPDVGTGSRHASERLTVGRHLLTEIAPCAVHHPPNRSVTPNVWSLQSAWLFAKARVELAVVRNADRLGAPSSHRDPLRNERAARLVEAEPFPTVEQACVALFLRAADA